MRKEWRICPVDSKKISSLTTDLGISSLLAQLLLNRGITSPLEAEKFLFKTFYDLPDPYQLKDMEKMVERLKKAIQLKERIMILGDYDVDGLTALALFYEFLSFNSVSVFWYLPHRIEEGYGISENAVRFAKEKDVSLFISVDCGITAFEEVKTLKNSAIDVLIVDHHRPRGNRYPPADAIIDPWQAGCSYPEKELTSAGLGFKVLQALLGSENEKLLQFLDLVCLGTVADVASLRGENRILVKYGLQALRETGRIGLRKLFEIAGLNSEKISVRNISYVIAPRLNAAGRVDTAESAFRLLLADSEEEAYQLARELEVLNKKRQEIEARILRESYALIEKEIDFSEEKIILISGPDWHPGVLGIVASKLTDSYYRPSIVLSEAGGRLKGSGRSVPEFNIFQAISKFEQFLEEFGGHSAACGITLRKENLEKLKQNLNNYAQKIYEVTPFIPKLKIDKEMDFGELNETLFKDIELLSPFGEGNPEPLFLTKGVKVISEPKALAKRFYRLWLKQANYTYQGLYRNQDEPETLLRISSSVNLVYTPGLEEWEELKNITLFIEDFQESP